MSFNESYHANVSGWHGNCGAHVFAHFIINNLGKPEFDILFETNKHYQNLLRLFCKYYNIDTTSYRPTVGILKAIFKNSEGLASIIDKEMTFGLVIKQHIASALLENRDFKNAQFQQFSALIHHILSAEKPEDCDNSLYQANLNHINIIKTHFLQKNPSSNNPTEAMIDAYLNKEQTTIKKLWKNTCFQKYVDFIGNSNNSHFLNVDELQAYADHMGIQLEVYTHNNKLSQNTPQRNKKLFQVDTLKIKNIGTHWTYEAPHNISLDDLAKQNSLYEKAPEAHPGQFLKARIQTLGGLREITDSTQQIFSNFTKKLSDWISPQNPTLSSECFIQANEILGTALDQTNNHMPKNTFLSLFNAATLAVENQDLNALDTLQQSLKNKN